MPMHNDRSALHTTLCRNQRGFSLIELMVTVAIVAILMGIAIPAYTRYTTEQGRSDGQVAIMILAGQLEKLKSNCGAYTNGDTINAGSTAGCTGLGLPNVFSAERRYSLSVVLDPGATGYTITATPQGVQAARDTDCGSLTYTHRNERGQTGPNTGNRCWRN